MKTRNLIAAAAIIPLLACCDNRDDIRAPKDTIKFSATEHTFEAAGGTFTVTSEGDEWCNGYACETDSYQYYYGDKVMEKAASRNTYPTPFTTIVPDTIKGPWFRIARPERKVLVIHADPNAGTTSRNFIIECPDRNHSSRISISQKAAQ